MTLEEEILEAAEKHDAFRSEDFVDRMVEWPWQEIDGRHYLTSKDIDPFGLMFNRPEKTVISHRWYYSIDAIMGKMKNNPDLYGCLFRNSVIAGIQTIPR